MPVFLAVPVFLEDDLFLELEELLAVAGFWVCVREVLLFPVVFLVEPDLPLDVVAINLSSYS